MSTQSHDHQISTTLETSPIATYYKNEEDYFHALIDAEEFRSRLVKINLTVINRGKRIADQPRITISVDSPITFPEFIPQVPTKPTPPKPPMMLASESSLVVLGRFYQEITHRSLVAVERWSVSNSIAVIETEDIMHDNKDVALPALYALLPADFPQHAFSIKSEVIDRNSSSPVVGELIISFDRE